MRKTFVVKKIPLTKSDGLEIYESFMNSRRKVVGTLKNGEVIECTDESVDNGVKYHQLADGRGWCRSRSFHRKYLYELTTIDKHFILNEFIPQQKSKFMEFMNPTNDNINGGLIVYSSCHLSKVQKHLENIVTIHCDQDYDGYSLRLSDLTGWVRKKYWSAIVTDDVPERDTVMEPTPPIHTPSTTLETTSVKAKTTTPRPKRKQLPKKVRDLVWKEYFDESIAQHLCLCCKKTMIRMNEFHVGHVVSLHDGGDSSIANLRPICAGCNLSMGTQNMIEFCIQYGYIIG